MQTYPQYYPQMNNYGQQYNPQQPYLDRLAGLQQYQQTLRQPQMQMQTQQMPLGLNGKMVDVVDQITANDVPMDGSVAIFPKKDMSEIYLKSWTPNGTIATVVFKPVLEDVRKSNPEMTREKLVFELSVSRYSTVSVFNTCKKSVYKVVRCYHFIFLFFCGKM